MFLDSLRFVAASAVVFQHVAEGEGGLGKYAVEMLSPGVFGVVLFFIVSGFVIPMSARGRFDPKIFAIRRFFRIYPLVLATFLLLAILAYGGFVPAFDAVRSSTFKDWAANLLLVQDYVGAVPLWGVTWTLSLEVAWYAVFAIALLSLGSRFDKWLAIIFPLAMLALALGSILIDHRLPLARVNMLYAAVLGCRIYRHLEGEVGLGRVCADVAAFLFATLVCNVVSFGHFTHPNITMSQAVFPWIAATLVFAGATLIPAVRRSYLLNNVVLGWLGAISFSTYLLHGFAMAIASDIAPERLVAASSVALTLAFSVLGYYLVEKPGQALGRIVTRRARSRTEMNLRLDSSTSR
ncbi:acyltransferase family protein [Aureimonas psammosilenae]|uniref:acyltransferase family protein n=1 Tax=Aureimonas psammosilenae TaxID=2495496 RepID=UPI001F48C941|nr:acyltransferase [Aureimonas psammosilenae]